jgi:hypothetical protein
LYFNTTGGSNTSVGVQSMYYNSTGANNTALGYGALAYNTTANNNTAVGYQAGYTNSTNTAGVFLGYQAGYLATGDNNTFVGLQTGYRATGGNNAFFGYNSGGAVTSGAKNTIIGSYSGNQGGLDIRTASNYIVLSDGDGNPRAYWNSSGNLLNSGTIGFGSNAANTALNSATTTNVTAGSSQFIYGTALAGNLGAYMMVRGVDASGNWFCDFLTFLNYNSVTVLSSMNGGSPGSRTYAAGSGTLSLNPSITQTSVRVSANELSL